MEEKVTQETLRDIQKKLVQAQVFEAEVKASFAGFVLSVGTETFFEGLMEPEWSIDDYLNYMMDAFVAQLDDPTPLYYFYKMDDDSSSPAERKAKIQSIVQDPIHTGKLHLAIRKWLRSLMGTKWGMDAFALLYPHVTEES